MDEALYVPSLLYLLFLVRVLFGMPFPHLLMENFALLEIFHNTVIVV